MDDTRPAERDPLSNSAVESRINYGANTQSTVITQDAGLMALICMTNSATERWRTMYTETERMTIHSNGTINGWEMHYHTVVVLVNISTSIYAHRGTVVMRL